ncbi:DNA starvation/stationary phase protection protein [Methylopila sp. 73B]|uniref:Dps family protein n=1 Tax=Methylopila sp. 73B TaxID=1120792 RepID=UPI000367820E|nr:DNA starvation/stationary phase protection protein [Methylopila sp. 73B]
MAKATVLKVASSSDEKIGTGLSDADRKVIAETLTDLTVQTYRLLLRSQVVHWNVTGPLFQPIHTLTQQHYRDLFAAIDEMAERIRALGHVMPTGKATSGLDKALSLGSRMTAQAMLEELAEDHESLARVVREGAAEAEDRRDFVTHDLLTARLAFHEKAVWMLRAIAEN